MGYIYKITNDVNNKVYIGQTKRSLDKRWEEHKKYALEEDSQTKFYNAIKEIGVEHFELSLIEQVDSLQERNEREKYWITFYNSFENGYNSTRGGGCFEWDGASKQELYDKIIELRLEGKTYDDICNNLHCGRKVVADALKEKELLNHYCVPLSKIEYIKSLLQQKLSYKDIMRLAKCSDDLIKNIQNKNPELKELYRNHHPQALYDDKILELRRKGLTYRAIAAAIPCPYKTVALAIKRMRKDGINI